MLKPAMCRETRLRCWALGLVSLLEQAAEHGDGLFGGVGGVHRHVGAVVVGDRHPDTEMTGIMMALSSGDLGECAPAAADRDDGIGDGHD